MAYEALYRRYRPSRFKDAFFGQDHVVAALSNAIEGDRVGHAYLFSGPRGTGKTTSARILAKALNCTNLQGGEPCNECDSCDAFQSGGSYDLHELDAASNNGVDAMRDLIGKVALGSPGRTKVYILDEVHMLSSGAENALLKTLEEPPPHVVFVLCTTEPNKVVPTIRSRTQHLEFSLLSANQVGELVDYVIGDAGLEITPEDRQYVIRAGGGSARDTLSALDQVVAAGGAPQGGEHLEALFQSLIDRDAPAALGAIDGALQAGRDAAGIGAALLHELRAVFLAAMRADIGHLPEAERDKATTSAASMPPGRVTRAIEVIGASLIEMRQAPDPRVDLEVAVMRLTRTDLDTNPAALVERLEAIEQQIAGGAPIAVAAVDSAVAPAQTPAAPAAAPEAAAPAPSDPATGQPVTGEPAEAAPAHSSAAQSAATTAPVPDNTVPPQAAPQASPLPAAPPAQAAGASAGQRGAAIARAELQRQGIGTTEPARSEAAPQTQASTADTPPTAGKTLADVRRERQAAAQAAAGAADPSVQANADARRERQAAAQAAGQAAAPSEDAPAAAAVAESPAPQEPVAPPAEAQVAPVVPSQEPAAPPAEAQVAPVVPSQGPAAPPAEAQVAPVVPSQEPAAPPAEAQVAPVVPPQEPVAVPAESQTAPAAGAAPAHQPTPAAGDLPSLADLQAVWQPLLETMSGRARSRFSAGHFMETTADSVVFGLPNPVHRDRCEEIRDEFDQALAAKFARPIPLTLIVDETEEEPDFFAAAPSGGAGDVTDAQADALEEATVDVHNLVDATGDIPSAEDRVMATFENSVLLEDPTNQPPNQ